MIHALVLIVAWIEYVSCIPCASQPYVVYNSPDCLRNGCANQRCWSNYCVYACETTGICAYKDESMTWHNCEEPIDCVSLPGSNCFLGGQSECWYGYYSDTPNNVKCSICAEGSYSGSGAVTCTTCCAAGSYIVSGCYYLGEVVCNSCLAGQYSNAGSTSCQNCAAGTSSAPGASACTACPVNFWSVSGAACTANAGYYDVGASMMAYYSFNPSDMLADGSGITGALTNIGAVICC